MAAMQNSVRVRETQQVLVLFLALKLALFGLTLALALPLGGLLGLLAVVARQELLLLVVGGVRRPSFRPGRGDPRLWHRRSP
jgi:hypothetical protein